MHLHQTNTTVDAHAYCSSKSRFTSLISSTTWPTETLPGGIMCFSHFSNIFHSTSALAKIRGPSTPIASGKAKDHFGSLKKISDSHKCCYSRKTCTGHFGTATSAALPSPSDLEVIHAHPLVLLLAALVALLEERRQVPHLQQSLRLSRRARKQVRKPQGEGNQLGASFGMV